MRVLFLWVVLLGEFPHLILGAFVVVLVCCGVGLSSSPCYCDFAWMIVASWEVAVLAS